ncbi:beta-galactosidase [Undibacterium cyanobacteriorum]|uniref:Beta-galactosidase n=1 Tax=Undibacterium cyanobacteriorum TaxID=3073561 RepID=A0ABY9RLE5_9BURK|nr:beta-galactosidase [Undibacterium sp. 20NA77.5]WMW81510.1 beta-galactosidase [Undibacterium sp. 20NA77.5]
MLNRRQFASITGLSLLAPAQWIQPAAAAQQRFSFAKDSNQFLLNDQPLQIRSGEMHPARIPKAYWLHRIQMAKAMGMNTIAIYVMWNYHEVKQGQFDFKSENRDIVHFIKLCQAEQLHVILRPGPYVCAEWDLGGIPAYLLADEDCVLRANSQRAPRYMQAASRYIAHLAKLVRPYMLTQGGPILMVQIENEFGSYGNDHAYLEELRALWIKHGIDGPFYTQDGYDQLMQNKTNLAGAAIGLSGGESADILKTRKNYPDVPVLSGELYPGWLTHWGDPVMQGKEVDMSRALKEMMDAGQSFNFYVIHGGTNFGFSAGANTEKGEYQPDVTSYDYAAPINEQGLATANYHRYRTIISESLGAALPPIPKPIKTLKESMNRPLQAQYFTSIWHHLPPAQPYARPPTMESMGQDSGFVLYQTTLKEANQSVQINELHDYALLHVNRQYQAGISRAKCPATLYPDAKLYTHRQEITLKHSANAELSILVEAMGHINYGRSLIDRKGIVSEVFARSSQEAAARPLKDWRVHRLPFDTRFISSLKSTAQHGAPQQHGNFFKVELSLQELGDCYLDMHEWVKGLVWVNGHCLGRYWRLGPQHRLYCPSVFLKKGKNEILMFDLHFLEAPPIFLRTSLEE